MKKILFVDRDGTIVFEPQDTKQINGLEQVEFLPFVISSLKKLQDFGYEIVVVSNQDGLGTAQNPQENYDLINNKIAQILAAEGIKITNWLTCPHKKSQNCECRKPRTKIAQEYIGKIDLEKSVMIGDRDTDIEFAQNLGIRGFKIEENLQWPAITGAILSRQASIARKTKETDIEIELNLDGRGKSSINSGLKFFDHMLEQVAKHGKFDLNLRCAGDLEIDEHHTIEDIAICLGSAFCKALGSKIGIARFASERIIPLDESISFVAIDISGRPFCKFDAKFEREYIGDFPTEMIAHFFQSFATSCEITLHIKIEGSNTHHKVESCFKSFATCLHDVSRIVSSEISSTKGLL